MLIRKALESTGMDHFNELPTPTKVGETIGTVRNYTEAYRDCPNEYASVMGMMLYLA